MVVSVIIPVYNSEKYLYDCLNSVVKQSLHDIEIICINDGSVDNSLSILNDYSKQDSRIRVINNKINRGLSYSRNVGMTKAEGKYLVFLDSDDMLLSYALEELYYKAEKEQTDILFFDSEMLIESDKFEGNEKQFCAKADYGNTLMGIDLLLKMQRLHDVRVPVWIQFWNKNSLDNMKNVFFEGVLHEDVLFTYIALIKAERVQCVNKTYHIYRRHDDTISLGEFGAKRVISLLEIYKVIENFWEENENDRINEVTKNYLNDIKRYINAGIMKAQVKLEDLEEEWGENSLYSYLLENILEPEAICKISKKAIIKLLKVPKVYIYGAGKIAKKCVIVLKSYGVEVTGVVVTNIKNNPEKILDINVCDIKKIIPYREECTILVGVGHQLREEVVDELGKLGFKNYELLD